MVQYGKEALYALKGALCNNCHKSLPDWDQDTSICWSRYIQGANREKLIEGTRFKSYVSPKYHFKRHACYKKISSVRKRLFRTVKTKVQADLLDYPWLIGLFYADGFTRTNKTQLAFALGKHEKIIADRVENELRSILGKEAHIARDIIGNMIQVRVHSSELCRAFPDKKGNEQFRELWNLLSLESKKKFIAGFIDGDGSCQYSLGINSVQIYSKVVPFILTPFRETLSEFGYVSQKEYRLYLSPEVGKMLKPYTEKKNISSEYNGNVQVELSFELLKNNVPMREIARRLKKDRKTITLALKKVYGMPNIQPFLDAHNKKLKLDRK